MEVTRIVLTGILCLNVVSGSLTNIALNKTANMSSTYGHRSLPAGGAVDGVKNTVFPQVINTAAYKQFAWWWVDLGTNVQDPTVTIYFRTKYICRRNGVHLYTSTTRFSSYPSGHLCHTVIGRADGTDIPDVVSVNCTGTWRYLMVYTNTSNCVKGEGPVLDFGEVEVLGCDGTYGPNCAKPCSSRQCAGNTSSCDRYTGACPGGCNPGYQGTDCMEVCVDTYGVNCSARCMERQCSGNSTCHHVTGKCDEGCLPGWNGTDCTHECPTSIYGYGCELNCRDRHCVTLSDTCEHTTGACPDDGCTSGWNGTDCQQECPNGTYGPNCMNNCSDRRCMTSSSTCDRDTGQCLDGCRDGSTGLDCINTCETNKYGINCSEDCGHCVGTCNPTNGYCTGGCEEGYNGTRCQTMLISSSPILDLLPAVVGGAGAGLLVIIIIVIICIACRRTGHQPSRDSKRTINISNTGSRSDYVNVDIVRDVSHSKKTQPPEKPKRSQAELTQEPLSDAVEDEEEILEESDPVPNRDYYNDIEEVIREIPVEELEDTVQKIKHRKGGFEAEYGRLPAGFTAPYTDSQKPENAGKNRFRGYYPYDHNRVRLSLLPDTPGSDYINASIIQSYDQSKTYIAAQAPNKKTVGDFWRMIWEHRCGRIIMLTGLVEGMQVKCTQYWPDHGSLETDHFRVEVEVTDTRADYTVRKMKVTSKLTGDFRTIVQYHYTSWPDHGVPDTLALVSFIWMIRRTDTRTDGPLLVHCSAGIGRTGTYIAVDSLLDQARGEGMVDVLGYVSVMRGQRKNMIQTKEQYECVFQCLVEMTKFGNTSMDVENFITSYNSRGMDSILGRKTIVEITQMAITESRNDRQSQHQMWVDGNQDFIVRTGPSLRQLNGYLVAETPHSGLEKLLWKLVEENDVHNMIIISPQQMDLYGVLTRTYGEVSVKPAAQACLAPDLTQVTLSLQKKVDGSDHDVKLYRWTGSRTMDSLSSLLLNHAHLQHLSAETSPVIVIHDNSERKYAVCLCIMVNIIGEIVKDRRVDATSHVRRFLRCCPDVQFTKVDVEKLYKFTQKCVEVTEGKNYANM